VKDKEIDLQEAQELFLLNHDNWKRWPDDENPNTDENLRKYDFISVANTLFYKEKDDCLD
jgi:hypothetical protein